MVTENIGEGVTENGKYLVKDRCKMKYLDSLAVVSFKVSLINSILR